MIGLLLVLLLVSVIYIVKLKKQIKREHKAAIEYYQKMRTALAPLQKI